MTIRRKNRDGFHPVIFSPRRDCWNPPFVARVRTVVCRAVGVRAPIQKQIEAIMRQSKETEGILESLNEGVIAFDVSAKVTFINQMACQLFGVPRNIMMGKSLHAHSEEFFKKCQEMNKKHLFDVTEKTIEEKKV